MNIFKKTLFLTMSLVSLASFCDDAAKVVRRFGDSDCVMVTKKLRAYKGKFDQLCADSIQSKNICTDSLSVNNAVNFGSACANNLCVSSMARIREICGLFRATAVLSINTTYTLGSPVNFDTILDDPNNNVTLAPFGYIAPVAGYYAITVGIDANNIAGTAVILGTPVSDVEILVNGVIYRQVFNAFLAFNSEQRTTSTTMLSLNAGDIVTVKYNVLVMDSIVGATDYAGTMTLLGNGTQINECLFKIHYLSSNCTTPTCAPCMPSPCDSSCIDTCSPCGS